MYAVVDAMDAERVGLFRWYLGTDGYAQSYDDTFKTVLMHRVVLALEPGNRLEVDHFNRDKLDNRRANLRVVTHASNGQNIASRTGATSQYRGVTWRPANRHRKWVATAKLDGRQIHIGGFLTELEAARAAAQWRAAHMPFSVEDPDLLAPS
jgi:hypothetical protein